MYKRMLFKAEEILDILLLPGFQMNILKKKQYKYTSFLHYKWYRNSINKKQRKLKVVGQILKWFCCLYANT